MADYQQALIQRYTQLTAQLQQNTVDAVAAQYQASPDYRAADAEAFAAQAAPVVQSGQEQMSTLTKVFLALLIGYMTGETAEKISEALTSPLTGPALLALDFARGLRGVDPAEVYQRPYREVWYALSRGVPFPEAVDEGRGRVAQLASTDVQLAKTHTAREVLRDDQRVVGYRRVLEGAYSCGLCVLASTQRYHKRQLMPIHPQCDCSVAPIVGDDDPGQVINDQAVADVHAAVAERFGATDPGGRALDYRKLLISHEHGEIGPVLTRREDEWTGPGEVNNGSQAEGDSENA